MHGFIPLEGPFHRDERAKSWHRIDGALDKPMAFFHQIIQILALPECVALLERPLLWERPKGWRIGGGLLDGD